MLSNYIVKFIEKFEGELLMVDIDDLFKKFDSRIQLSYFKESELRRGRDVLRLKIKKWFQNNGKLIPKFCWQGSFAMKTTISLSINQEYDLDDGVYLNAVYADYSPHSVHSWIRQAVVGHTQKVIDKDTCVRVVYANKYHIDYPIYIIDGNGNANLAHKTKGWIVSDPKAFKDWFIDLVNRNGEQLRRTVRYLKAWKEFSRTPLKGIELTILVAENFSATHYGDLYILCDTVENIIHNLSRNYSCEKPVLPYEDLFASHTSFKKMNIMQSFNELHYHLLLAYTSDNLSETVSHLRAVFGEKFPSF